MRVAVLGCGSFGPHLVRNLAEAGVDDLVVFDPHEDRRERVAHAIPGVRAVPSVDAALHADAVVVTTPPDTHAALATLALEAGCHVLVEKPMTVNPHTARALVDLAFARERVLAVDHTALYEPAFTALQRGLAELGHVRGIHTVRRGRGSAVDELWDLAPHDLAVLDALWGPWSDVTCTRVAEVRRAEITLTWDDGRIATVTVEAGSPQTERATELVGDRGRLGVNALTHRGPVEPLRAVVDDFLRAIRTGVPTRSGGRLGARVVDAIAEAVRTSRARAGTPD
ncbi:MAG: Gfo/Idh/MocA family oxidoreductase [Myxococcota bacterium]